MAALILDHQKPNLKHFCKICKKGFGCGRALGGHMRAHGIVSDDSPSPSNILDGDDPDPDPDFPHNHHHHHHSWDDHHNKPINRRMYALRTNPNRLKTCRVCHNCGKEFFSWKSFLEHGKCTISDDPDDSILSSPPYSDDDDDDEDECTATPRRASGSNNNNWSKRKRSLRVKVGSPASNEEEDLANCLMMLSNGRVVEPMLMEGDAEAEAEAEESCASASKDDHHLLLQQQQDHNHHRNYNYNNNNNNIRKPINFIPPISYRLPDTEEENNNNKAKGTVGAGKGMFECKACKKVFNSHQALGGHRASHKKVKGCFAARLDHMDLDARENDDVYEDSLFPTKTNHNSSSSAFHYENPMASVSKRKTKVHECSICHRIFSSGQALGGHKRCHWITSNAAAAAAAAEAPKFHDKRVVTPAPANFNSITANSQLVLPLDLKLDLNLPAPADEVRRPAFEVSTEIHLQSWACTNDKAEENECDEEEQKQGRENKMMMKNEEENKGNKNSNIVNNEDVEEEAESKVKLAKLSELKDMNMSAGNSSPWLQVGIASTTHVVTPDP
ncbi:uncharacterized protein LOC120092028 [Benincasa hispida]|uniref:uncharacterized protein LOC120092028 n=1 Tax=Benincasa hispida TaxID=102211 RepID=UPI001900F226|nr:uncharacterized protein LOC120092028 [Benincasa hispida]